MLEIPTLIFWRQLPLQHVGSDLALEDAVMSLNLQLLHCQTCDTTEGKLLQAGLREQLKATLLPPGIFFTVEFHDHADAMLCGL